MRFNSGSSIKNNAYSSSGASSNTNEKLKKLNEELDQLELLVSSMQTSISSANSKIGTDTVADQIAAAKTEIENAIGQEVTTEKVTASEADIDTIVSNIIRTDQITPSEEDSIEVTAEVKVSSVKLTDAAAVSKINDVKVPDGAIAWIGTSLVVNKGNGNALIFSKNDDISYHFVNDDLLIYLNKEVRLSYIYTDEPVEVIAHQDYDFTSVNSGLTIIGPFYADLAAATFQNITVSNNLTAKTINAENISVSEDVNVSGTVAADKVEANDAEIEEIKSDTITSDRINSSQIHTKIDKENIGYTTVQEHQDTEEYAIGIPITNGLWEIELEGYIKATIDKTNSAVLITYWRDSESALTRVGVKDGVFYFYTRRSGKLYFSNNTLEVNDTTVSVNAPNDPGYPVPETLDKEINIVTNEGVIATETMVVDNLIVTGDFSIKDFVADKVAIRITDEDQDFNVAFTAPLPDPEEAETSNNYIYGDSDLTYNPTTNTLGTGNIKVEKDITLVDSVDEDTEEMTYSSGEAYQYLSVSCEADGETLRAHWEDAADTISCENPKLTSSQTIAAYNGKTAENQYPITHLGKCTTLHGDMGDGYLCICEARIYAPAFTAGADTVCKLIATGACNPQIYDRTTRKYHDVASWICEAPRSAEWNSMVCNDGLSQKLTITDHVKAACVTACDTVLACCHLESRGDLTVAGKTHISGDLYVDGTTHYVDTETSTIQDDTLVLRTNAQTGLGYDKVSGIIVNKYNGTDSLSMVTDCTGTMRVGTGVGTDTCYAAICFNNDDKKWYVNDVETSVSGNLTSWATKTENDPYTVYTDAVFTTIDLTSLEPVLTRAESSDLTEGLPLVWDSTDTKAVTSDEAVVKYEPTALPNEPVNKLYGITESVAITNMKLKEFALKYFELSGNNYVPKANTLSTSVTIGSDTDVNVTTISSDFTLVNGTISTTKSTRISGTVNAKKFYIGETTNCKYYNVGSGDGDGSAVSIDDNSSSACTYNIIQTCDDELYCSCNLTYVPSTGTLYAPNLTSCCINSIDCQSQYTYSKVFSDKCCIQLCHRGGWTNCGSLTIGGDQDGWPVRLTGYSCFNPSVTAALCLGTSTKLERLDDRTSVGLCYRAYVDQIASTCQKIGIFFCNYNGAGCPANYVFDAYDAQNTSGADYHYQRTVCGTTEFVSCHKYNNTTGRFQVCCDSTKGWLNYVTEDELSGRAAECVCVTDTITNADYNIPLICNNEVYKAVSYPLTYNPETGVMKRNGDEMAGYSLTLSSANGATRYALIDTTYYGSNFGDGGVIEGKIYINTFSIVKSDEADYIYRHSEHDYGALGIGRIGGTTCVWIRYSGWRNLELFGQKPIKLVCSRTTVPEGITFNNSISCAYKATYATYADAISDCTVIVKAQCNNELNMTPQAGCTFWISYRGGPSEVCIGNGTGNGGLGNVHAANFYGSVACASTICTQTICFY